MTKPFLRPAAVPTTRVYLETLGKAYQDVIGGHCPVITLVQVADLAQDRARVEIEATAVVPD